jgi:hypothetical protein
VTTLDFLVLALATWRVAYMLTHEAGPFNVFQRLRERIPENGHGRLGDLLSCIWCMSVWVGAGCVVIWYAGLLVVLYPFAASAGALMLMHFTGAGVTYDG